MTGLLAAFLILIVAIEAFLTGHWVFGVSLIIAAGLLLLIFELLPRRP